MNLFLPQMSPGRRRAAQGGFSLLEILVALSVFLVLLTFLLYFVGGVQRAWNQGEQMVEVHQSGRAALDMMTRELSSAVVSSHLQFVQNPDLSEVVDDLAPGADSLFWASSAGSSQAGGPAGIGYYLTRDPDAGQYCLMRFCVYPDNTAGAYLLGQAPAGPFSAPWLTDLPPAAFDSQSGGSARAVSIISDRVIGLWIQCYDLAGNAIPHLGKNAAYEQAGTLKFNSAAAFRMTLPPDSFDGGVTFLHTAPPPENPPVNSPNPVPAHRLPGAVEITLMLVDGGTLRRHPEIPPMPPSEAPGDIPAQVSAYQQQLVERGIQGVSTFTTRVRLGATR